MDTAAFDYVLPPDRIAQHPCPERDAARLLVDGGPTGAPEHRHVRDLPGLVGPGDVIVVNHTEVLPARLRLRKRTGGAAEVLLLEPGPVPGEWEALVRPGRRLPPGTPLFPPDAAGAEPALVVGDDLGDGRRRVTLVGDPTEHGEIPLPPYITEPLADPGRYQTVYAHTPASAAAPTAGLHLTPAVIEGCRDAGATLLEVELVVGLGTFRPISAARVEDHTMHHERYRVAPDVLDACLAARRVIAVGTTTLRALESAAATGRLEGRTDLFVHRPYPFRVVDVLLTNFHVPRSSLLVLVDAFVGDRWRALYDEALATGYRFLSFGDAMLLQRSAP